MTNVTATSTVSRTAAPPPATLPPTPQEIARDLVRAASDRLGRVNYGRLLQSIDALTARDPQLGAEVERALQVQLGPRGYQQMAEASYTTRSPDGSTMTFSRVAPSIEQYAAGTAYRQPGGVGTAVTDRAHYARLDRIWGDGNPRTVEGDAIRAGISEMLASGMSLQQAEAISGSRRTAELNRASEDSQRIAADLGQMALDIVGIFDPTPTADLVNAGISAWRGDGWGAFLSVISAVPYVGDLAKLGKLGRWAQTISEAVELATRFPALRAALEPALRGVSDVIGALGQRALNTLPADARNALLDMKGRIDNLLGAGGRQADEVVRPSMVNDRPQQYIDGAGTRGNWRSQLNRRLDADTDYHVNGYKFSTDAQGRVSSVEGRLTLQTAERNTYQQGVAGRADRLPDDQGGHLIASIFNGPGEAINLQAMNGNFNMGAYRRLEDTLADALRQGSTVDIKIDVFHSPNSVRPEGFRVTYEIDGVQSRRVFSNQAGG
jgi:hypothetical protein